MNLILLTAIVISLFAVGSGFTLLLSYRDWRFGFFAGLALFAAAWVAAQTAHLFGEAGGFFTIFEQYKRAFPTLVLSVLALSVMFFLERIIHTRAETQQNLHPEPETLILVAGGAAKVLGPNHTATRAFAKAARSMDRVDLWRARLAAKRLRKYQREAIAAAVES
jgi:hypothetical protein